MVMSTAVVTALPVAVARKSPVGASTTCWAAVPTREPALAAHATLPVVAVLWMPVAATVVLRVPTVSTRAAPEVISTFAVASVATVAADTTRTPAAPSITARLEASTVASKTSTCRLPTACACITMSPVGSMFTSVADCTVTPPFDTASRVRSPDAACTFRLDTDSTVSWSGWVP